MQRSANNPYIWLTSRGCFLILTNCSWIFSSSLFVFTCSCDWGHFPLTLRAQFCFSLDQEEILSWFFFLFLFFGLSEVNNSNRKSRYSGNQLHRFLQLLFKRTNLILFVGDSQPLVTCVSVHTLTTGTFPCLPNRWTSSLTRRTTFKSFLLSFNFPNGFQRQLPHTHALPAAHRSSARRLVLRVFKSKRWGSGSAERLSTLQMLDSANYPEF